MSILCTSAGPSAAPLAAATAGTLRVTTELSAVDSLLDLDPHEVLVIVGADIDLDTALEFAARQRLARPTVGVVLLRDGLDVGVLSRAIRAGVREVVPADDLDQLAAACERSVELSRAVPGAIPFPAAPPPAAGKIVAVFATKGGCGKTTVSTNLAVALHADNTRRVCLVDLDLAFGDVAITLRLMPKRTLVDGVAMGERIDETGVAGLLTPFRPGLDCVLAPVEPGDAETVPAALITDLLRVLRGMFDYIVVDTPPQFNEHVLALLDAADHHVLLTNPDMPTLKNLRLTLDMLDLLGNPKEIRTIVLNREDSRVGMTVADIERVAKADVAVRIPASLDVPASINRGVPITIESPNHGVSVAIRDLANRTIVGVPADTEQRRGGFLRLRRRSA